jgi:hypothetical protein
LVTDREVLGAIPSSPISDLAVAIAAQQPSHFTGMDRLPRFGKWGFGPLDDHCATDGVATNRNGSNAWVDRHRFDSFGSNI